MKDKKHKKKLFISIGCITLAFLILLLVPGGKNNTQPSQKSVINNSSTYDNRIVPQAKFADIPNSPRPRELSLGRHIFIKGDSSLFSLPPFCKYDFFVIGKNGITKLYIDNGSHPLTLTTKSKINLGAPDQLILVVKDGLLVIDLYAPIAKPFGVGKNLPRLEDFGL